MGYLRVVVATSELLLYLALDNTTDKPLKAPWLWVSTLRARLQFS